MKNVVLLGSTGSIGTSTCKVAEDLPDCIRLIGLAAGRNDSLLAEQTRQFKPAAISITDESKAAGLRESFADLEVHSGDEGLIKLATMAEPESLEELAAFIKQYGQRNISVASELLPDEGR